MDRDDRFALARCASFFGNWNHVDQRFACWCDNGLNTKIHAVCDALGKARRFKLTPGNLSDVGEAPKLMEGLSAKALLAANGYDSNAVVELAQAGAMEAITLSRTFFSA